MTRLPRLAASAALIGLLALAGPAPAQERQPLLMPGKDALYQQVIARPGARLFERAGARREGEAVTPFTVFYVYERQAGTDGDWVQVGTGRHGGVDGWLRAGSAIDWKQSLTVTFKEPLEHGRVLLFRDRQSLQALVDAHDIAGYRRLRRQAEANAPGEDSPVVAIQPPAHVDIHEDFYLVPILEHRDVLLAGQAALMLRVASVPLAEQTEQRDRRYRSGIVFVVDSTISMGPYIERMREIIRSVYRSLAAAELEDAVSFGLIAFRDSTGAVPALDYVTRSYATLADGLDERGFFERVRQVRPAPVSSEGFNEDAFAGVKAAIEGIDWSGYDARYVVLITDAGPRAGHDERSATGLDAESLRRLARARGIALWALHLRTPEGADNHDYAAGQYRRLTRYEGIGDFYYPVTAGELEGFAEALETMTTQLTEQVRAAQRGTPPLPVPERPPAGEDLAAFQQKSEKLGYALRMRYLQALGGGGVPAVFDAWMLDRAFENPERRAVQVRVLLTRDQLSDLQSVLKKVLETAELGALAPEDFLNDLQSLAAAISRDPQAAADATRAAGGGANLADLGYMREYIEDLPYRGEVMNLDLAIWEQWPAQRQFEFINTLESKIAYYRALHENLDLWISLDGGPVDGDSVYPLALEALP